MNLETLDKSDVALIAASDRLRKTHELYTSTISSKGMALSLETSALVWVLCDEMRPKTVVDMGSGFSSFVVREWAKEQDYAVEVWSTDDDLFWVEQSRKFCEQQGVSTENFSFWSDFPTSNKFDFILYDLGRMPARNANLTASLDMINPGGVVVIDDCHKFNYSKHVSSSVADRGMTLINMKNATVDAHEGRHAWVAK